MTGSDRELVKSILAAGDETAFRELYRRVTPTLYRLALRLTGGHQTDAEDVVQEAWQRIVRSLPSFRWQSSFSTWAYGVTLRSGLDALRRASRRPTGEADTDPSSLAGGSPDDPEVRVDLERAFEAMPPGYRAVLVLHVEGYRHAEIAETLGIAPGTSKSQLARARGWLRAAMEPRKSEAR